MAKLRDSLAKRAEVLRRAALQYHAGNLSRRDYLRTVVTFRKQ